MPIRNQHWYDQNGSIAYPVADDATCLDDAGGRLPPNIIVDLHLKWPSTFGQHAFIAGVTVTGRVVTVVIQAATTPDDAGSFVPLAVVTVAQPVAQGRVYALQAQVPGVGGWIVFGDGVVDATYTGRFSSPTQSRLVPRAARSYRPLPITGMQLLGADTILSGLVALKTDAPLELVREGREIDGVLRDCLVLRLTDADQANGVTAPPAQTPSDNIFRQFAGPCAGRPESGTCPDPQPVEFLNAAGPDCDGVITLQFDGCAATSSLGSNVGARVACGLGLSSACLEPYIPNDDGFLPGDYIPTEIPPYVPPTTEPPTPPAPDTPTTNGALPYTDCFDDGSPDNFVVVSGEWGMTEDDSPDPPCPSFTVSQSLSISASTSISLSLSQGFVQNSYTPTATAERNLTLWNGFEAVSVFRRVQTDLRLNDGGVGSLHNGGLVINYRESTPGSGIFVYYVAELDYETQVLRLKRFNGIVFVTISEALLPGIALGDWYRLAVTIVAGALPGQTELTVDVQGLSVPTVGATMVVTTTGYQPSTGLFGFYTDRALTSFAYFQIAEAP